MVPFTEIFMYKWIPQYHEAYSFHYEFATEVNNNKLIFNGGIMEREKDGGRLLDSITGSVTPSPDQISKWLCVRPWE